MTSEPLVIIITGNKQQGILSFAQIVHKYVKYNLVKNVHFEARNPLAVTSQEQREKY